MNFAARLKELRKERKLSQQQMAKELSISESTYRGYEQGTDPRVSSVMKIAKYFSVSVDYLLGLSDK